MCDLPKINCNGRQLLFINQIILVPVGADPDKVEDEAEDSEGEKGEEAEDYLNDPDFQNMSDSEGDDLPLFEVCKTTKGISW